MWRRCGSHRTAPWPPSTRRIPGCRRDGAGGDFYPLARRAGALLAGAADDLEAGIEALYADLVGHAGGALTDDAVLLLLTRRTA
jgi:hypothetical protein